MEKMNYEKIDPHVINQYHHISSISAIKLYSVLYITPPQLAVPFGPRHLHLQRQSHGLGPLHAAAAGADGAVEANLIHFHSFCTWEPWLVEP